MGRRSNPLTNYAILSDMMARGREAGRREYEEQRHLEQQGYDVLTGDYVYSAAELGLMYKATDQSVSDEERKLAVDERRYIERIQSGLDWIKDDFISHWSVLRYSSRLYFRSPLMMTLTALMIAGHALMLAFMLTAALSGDGASPLEIILVVWTIYNAVALTFIAFSPLFLSSLRYGIWKLVGGKSHRVVTILVYTSAVPAILGGSMFVFGASNPNPVAVATFLSHTVLPLIIRGIASQKIRSQIGRLSYVLDNIEQTLEADKSSAYLESLLERKVIGTAGASLGTSEFSSDQVAAGVAGERKTAKLLDAFARRNDNTIVFHSVRWNMDGAPYDIDHVVVIGQRVFFLDSKNWSKGNYMMLASGDTVLRDGESIPNGGIHIQSGADTYINAFGIRNSITQVVVWTEGTLSNQSASGPRLVTSTEMLDWLEQSARDELTSDEGYNVPLLRSLEAHTA